MKIIKYSGGISYDDRGHIVYNNDFIFNNIKRFYIIENDKNNFIRAWHAHKKEIKYFFCIKGKFQISLIKIDNFKNPSKKLKSKSYILDSNISEILRVPKGYANGTMNLKQGSQLMVFSNLTLKQSLNDDFRFPFDYWNNWKIIQR